MFDEIREEFIRTHSIKETVERTGQNEYKVRRALITLGLWESRRSREVLTLLNKGLSTEEIAAKLCLSVKGVESYLPYTRGAYLEELTQSAVDSKNYRNRMKTVSERQVAKKGKITGESESKVSINDPKDSKVYKIKLEIDTQYADIDALRKYGRVKEGIIRTILAPATMQLNRLNYAIQKCFGWQNCHLHHFLLSDEKFEELTKSDLDEWKKLAGVWFRCYDYMDADNDIYYLDDYDGKCSIRTWLKRKYTGQYLYSPRSESPAVVSEFASGVIMRENMLWAQLQRENPEKVLKKTPADDLRYTLSSFAGMELLERLELKDVFGLDNKFFYEYDFGDGWSVKITLLEEFSGDAVADVNAVSSSSVIREGVKKVIETNAPVCVEADGYNVFDDVGGVNGFCNFLKGLNGEDNDFGHEPDSYYWANDLGWRPIMSKPEKIL